MKTYLYIKTHNITGLKYFGKTTRNPNQYRGSGKYWLNHLRKHGNFVTTEILGEFLDNQLLTETALLFSVNNDIANSTEWANLINENGFDGAPIGNIVSEETKTKISKKLLGKKSPKSRYILQESVKIRGDRTRLHTKDTIWINDGINDTRIKNNETIPTGWTKGRCNTKNLRIPVGGNSLGNNTKGKKIYNNGIIHKYFTIESVLEGFLPGKMDGFQGGTGSHRKGKGKKYDSKKENKINRT